MTRNGADVVADDYPTIPDRTSDSIPNLHRCLHKEIRNGVEFCRYHDNVITATLSDHDLEVRKKEREKVIDEIMKWRQTETKEQCSYYESWMNEHYYLKNLRG
jgi:anthranilate/para-aminobenzoate synthase component II